MPTVEVIPHLTVDDTMYDLAMWGIDDHAPDLEPLTWKRFTDPDGWALIPDTDGEVSKAELTLLNGVGRTVKLNVWYRPDVRGGEEEKLHHNHRWSTFTGYLLRGGYDELRSRRINIDPETGLADVVVDPLVTHNSPDGNVVPHDVFHEVVRIHEPGTMSLMVCGYGEYGDWCHVDIPTGKLITQQPVAGFNDMYKKLTPHLP